MKFLLSFAVVFVASLDVLAIGIACNLAKKRLKFWSEIIITIISTAGILLAMLLGKFIVTIINADICDLIAGTLLIIISLKLIWDTLKRKSQGAKVEKADKNKNGMLEVLEILVIAFALAINNIVLGISAYLMELSIIVMVILTFLMTFAFLKIAKLCANFFAKTKFLKIAEIISALIILTLGVLLILL